MKHYTLAKVTNLEGNEVAGGKYLLYTTTEDPNPRWSHTFSSEIPVLIDEYLSIVRGFQHTTLSTKPSAQFISLSIGNGKTATLRLEKLFDSEKQKVKEAILKAEK